MANPFPGASQYKDRHGVTRWRYRKGDISIELPGNPEIVGFSSAYAHACNGISVKPGAALLKGKTELRRESALVDYIHPALRRAKGRSKSQGVAYSIDAGVIIKLLQKQGWRCAVSGIAFQPRADADKPFRPSIDRIIPSLGYIPENIRIVCEIVNVAMNSWGDIALNSLVDAMIENRRRMKRLKSIGEP